MEERNKMSKYFETVDFWVENLLDSTESYTIESNEKGKFVLFFNTKWISTSSINDLWAVDQDNPNTLLMTGRMLWLSTLSFSRCPPSKRMK